MRHTNHGRHARRRALSLRHYLMILLASVAALVTTLSFSSSPSKAATAVPAAHQARTVTAAPALDAVNKTALARSARTAAARLAALVLAEHTYTVRGGDSMSGVAATRCKAAQDWTGIYAASRARGWTGVDANAITIGQHLYLACAFDASQLRFAAQPRPVTHMTVTAAVTHAAPARPSGGKTWGVTQGYPNWCGDGDGDGWDVSCTARSTAPPVSTYRAPAPAASSYSGAPGSFQACVIRAESGGNPQAVNASSGAGGLYQFLPSTWAALGFSGLPENASVATQNAAFAKAYAQSGTSPWAPYDGC